MIRGQVTEYREAVVELSIRGSGGTLLTATAVLDTGFSDYLTLHPDEIIAFGLNYDGTTRIILANGTSKMVRVYYASVDWDGERRAILVQSSEGGHLIGMRMLGGCTITMDVCVDGSVMIETDTCDPFD